MKKFSDFISEQTNLNEAKDIRFINREHIGTVFTLKVGKKHSYLYNSHKPTPTRIFTGMTLPQILSQLASQGFVRNG
jgi:hypothetical protein